MGTIITGSVVGLRIGGNANTAGWSETSVPGPDGKTIPIRFEPGDNLRSRQVQIGNSGMMTTIAPGMTTQMTVDGLSMRSDGRDLYVNGHKVDFLGGKAPSPAEASAAQQSARAALEKRFPGVDMTGHEWLQIGPNVKIEAGATLEGTPPGLVLEGDTIVGPEATIRGGNITDSRIFGSVRGGVIEDSTIGARASVDGGNLESVGVDRGARISGGILEDVRVGEGATISGGNIEDSTIGKGAVISGGNLERMTIGDGCVVSGGNLEGFSLDAGQVVSRGSHDGALSAQTGGNVTGVTIRGGSFSGDVNVVLGNVSAGMNVVGVELGDITIGDNVTIKNLKF